MSGDAALKVKLKYLDPERGNRVRRIVLVLASPHACSATDTSSYVNHHSKLVVRVGDSGVSGRIGLSRRLYRRLRGGFTAESKWGAGKFAQS